MVASKVRQISPHAASNRNRCISLPDRAFTSRGKNLSIWVLLQHCGRSWCTAPSPGVCWWPAWSRRRPAYYSTGSGPVGHGHRVGGAGLIWLSRAADIPSYYAAWTLLGVAMSLTLYEAAFATINRKFASGSRQVISTLTLFAGFASTVFWPLTLKLSVSLGWRDTYFWFG